MLKKSLGGHPNPPPFVQEGLIKSSEREIRGQAETCVIRSPDIRIPPDFYNFLNNGTNKERLLELIEHVWKGEAAALRLYCWYFIFGP